MLPRASLLRRHPKALAAVVVALAALLAVGLFALYVRGGGPLPPALRFLAPAEEGLAAGTPEEIALRTLRLAGYDRAVVGEEGGVAVVRVALPGTDSAADVELSWQTALAVAAEVYPEAHTCVAQLFSGSQALLEVKAPAEDVRGADAEAVREASTFRYLSEGGGK